ncbi:MAG: hypothetical protein K1X72_16115 [Pyrinomonadaceae bacterium]|nr:hypothetical protein [Pyrinomonadaceae bacterium]
MKHKILISIFSIFLIISFGNVEQVRGCSCVDYTPQEVYNLADIVFIGKAVEGLIEIKEGENQYMNTSEFQTFEVTEAFSGVKKGEIIKVDGGEFGYCSFSIPFFKNNEYVIYARKNEKKNIYETNYCLRSKMTDVATNGMKEFENFLHKKLMEDIDFLREALPLKKNALLIGRVGQTTDDASIAKISINDKNFPKRTYFTKSNDQGNFSIELPEGEYRVEVETPKGKKLTKWSKEKLKSIKLRRGGEMKLFIDLEKVK